MDINIINTDNFDIKQMVLSKSVFVGTNKKKISIGYGDNTDFYLLTPLFTNNMDFLSNHKYQYLKMIFDPMLGHILKFYNIIQSIETSIKDHIIKHNKNYTLQSAIRNDSTDLFIDENDVNFDIDLNNIKNMYLKLTNYSKTQTRYTFYDANCTECSLSNLKNGWKFKALIKIDSVWIDTMKKKFGLNIELVQLKILQPIIQTKCLIDNDVLIMKNEIYRYSNNTYNVSNNTQSNMATMTLNTKQNSIIPNPPPVPVINSSVGTNNDLKAQVFIPPNPIELLKMKNALKKVLD
jgi:hypothetical protein